MARGGARNRSGPAKDPTSGRSERANYVLTALPRDGYDGEVPSFPLPPMTVAMVDEDGDLVDDDEESERVWQRELDLWSWAWTTPQACAWIMAPWRWHTVAMWVRTAVTCEGPRATAADKNSLHRFADQIGLTPAGLKENGWAIGEAAVNQDGPEQTDDEDEDDDDPRRRMGLTVVNGGA